MSLSHTEVSRRRFLRRSLGAAAAGVAAPYFVPHGVLADDSQPGANERIGIGGIGIGRQGSGVLAEALRGGLGRFVAVADVNLPRAQATAKQHGGAPYQDYRKLLERNDVDAIVTATPEHWRSLICIEACLAGKDLYVEKPMTLTIAEGRKMVAAARKHGRVFQVGSQQRSMPIDIWACEFIRGGGLGKLAKVHYWNYPTPWECALPGQPVPAGLDWEMWCGPTAAAAYHPELYIPRGKPGWLSFRLYSGGEFTGWGAHGLDMIQYALGADAGGPVEVWTEGPAFTPLTYAAPESSQRGNGITNKPNVFFRYANGVTLEPVEKAPSFGAIFCGARGTMTVDRGKVISDPPELAAAGERELKARGALAGAGHVRNWLDCVKSRQRPTADAEIGHRSATVCHLGNIARWTNRRLKWDPAAERFVDDEAANAYLDRERRKGYALPEVG